MDPFDELPPDFPTTQQEADAVNAREALLLKAKVVSRRIAERFWNVIDAHNSQPADGQPLSRD